MISYISSFLFKILRIFRTGSPTCKKFFYFFLRNGKSGPRL